MSQRSVERHIAVIVCAILVSIAAAPGAGESCTNLGNTRLLSPDKTRELVLFVRRCGDHATRELAIVDKGAPLPDKPGNIDVPGHSMRTTARWETADILIVGIPGNDPLPKPAHVGGVTVIYARIE